jgi:hypothetical protein
MEGFERVTPVILNAPLCLVAYGADGKINRSVDQADSCASISTGTLETQVEQPLDGRGAGLPGLTLCDSFQSFADGVLHATVEQRTLHDWFALHTKKLTDSFIGLGTIWCTLTPTDEPVPSESAAAR